MSRPSRGMSITVERREKAALGPLTNEEALLATSARTINRGREANMESSDGTTTTPGAYAVQLIRRSQRMLQDTSGLLGSSTRSWDPTASLPEDTDFSPGPAPEEMTHGSSAALPLRIVPTIDADVVLRKETNKRRWHVAIVVVVVVAAMIGGGLGAYFASKENRNSHGSAATQAGECDFFPVPDPSPVLQCSCFSKISISSESTMTIYSDIRASQLFSEYSGPDDECSPENIALWWSAIDMADVSGIFATNDTIKQRFGLALLHLSLGGWSSTYSTEWLGTGSECEWKGVTCNSLLQVSAINLLGQKLNGELPSSIFRFFPALTYLNLSVNSLYGRIPVELWELAKLKVLDLSSNNFEGSIPEGIHRLSKLTSLILNNLILSSTIPEGFYSLTSLVELDFSVNSITGTLSEELGLLSNLKSVTMKNTGLIGSLPSSVGLLTALTQIDLRGNAFIGTLPSELGLLDKSLKTIDLSYNDLTGTLQTTIGNLTKLAVLSLDANGFTGSLPEVFGNLLNLQVLTLSSNRLTGSLPSLQVSYHLDLSGNNFVGTAPTSYCSSIEAIVPCSVQCSCCVIGIATAGCF